MRARIWTTAQLPALTTSIAAALGRAGERRLAVDDGFRVAGEPGQETPTSIGRLIAEARRRTGCSLPW
jgi:hypothetical protein